VGTIPTRQCVYLWHSNNFNKCATYVHVTRVLKIYYYIKLTEVYCSTYRGIRLLLLLLPLHDVIRTGIRYLYSVGRRRVRAPARVSVLLVTCIRSVAPPSDGFCFVVVCMVFFPPPRRESLLAYSVTAPFASSVPATCNTASKLLYDIVHIIVVVLAVIIVVTAVQTIITLFKFIIIHAR